MITSTTYESKPLSRKQQSLYFGENIPSTNSSIRGESIVITCEQQTCEDEDGSSVMACVNEVSAAIKL